MLPKTHTCTGSRRSDVSVGPGDFGLAIVPCFFQPLVRPLPFTYIHTVRPSRHRCAILANRQAASLRWFMLEDIFNDETSNSPRRTIHTTLGIASKSALNVTVLSAHIKTRAPRLWSTDDHEAIHPSKLRRTRPMGTHARDWVLLRLAMLLYPLQAMWPVVGVPGSQWFHHPHDPHQVG